MIQNTDRSKSFETILSLERTRLVHLCARLTGDSNAAEDLAQETLLEAWRHFDALRDQQIGKSTAHTVNGKQVHNNE